MELQLKHKQDFTCSYKNYFSLVTSAVNYDFLHTLQKDSLSPHSSFTRWADSCSSHGKETDPDQRLYLKMTVQSINPNDT